MKWLYSEIVVSYLCPFKKNTSTYRRLRIAAPTVNNVSILTDYTLPNGNEVFLISEVLFVSEAVVSKLHQVYEYMGSAALFFFKRD